MRNSIQPDQKRFVMYVKIRGVLTILQRKIDIRFEQAQYLLGK